MELELKRKQAFWETPRNLVIIIGTIAATVAGLAGVIGYKIANQPQGITLPPGTVITIPPR